MVKNTLANVGDSVKSLGWEDPESEPVSPALEGESLPLHHLRSPIYRRYMVNSYY